MDEIVKKVTELWANGDKSIEKYPDIEHHIATQARREGKIELAKDIFKGKARICMKCGMIKTYIDGLGAWIHHNKRCPDGCND